MGRIIKEITRRENVSQDYRVSEFDFLLKLFNETVVEMVNGTCEKIDGSDFYFSEQSKVILSIDWNNHHVFMKKYGRVVKEYIGC